MVKTAIAIFILSSLVNVVHWNSKPDEKLLYPPSGPIRWCFGALVIAAVTGGLLWCSGVIGFSYGAVIFLVWLITFQTYSIWVRREHRKKRLTMCQSEANMQKET